MRRSLNIIAASAIITVTLSGTANATKWSKPIPLPGTGIDPTEETLLGLRAVSPGPVSLSYSQDGTLHAAYLLANKQTPAGWQERLNYYHQANYAQLAANQNSFSAKQLLSDPNKAAFSPKLVSQTGGLEIFAWGEQQPGGGLEADTEPQLLSRSGQGGRLAPISNLSYGGASNQPFQLSLDGDNRALALFTSGSSSGLAVQQQPEQQFSEPSYSELSNPRLLQKPDGRQIISSKAGKGEPAYYGNPGGELNSLTINNADNGPLVYPAAGNKLNVFWTELKTRRVKGIPLDAHYLYTAEIGWGEEQLRNKQLLSKNGFFKEANVSRNGQSTVVFSESRSQTERLYSANKSLSQSQFSRRQLIEEIKLCRKCYGISELSLVTGADGKQLIAYQYDTGAEKMAVMASARPAGAERFEKAQRIAALNRPEWFDGEEYYSFELEIPAAQIGPQGQMVVAWRHNQGKKMPNLSYRFKLVKAGK